MNEKTAAENRELIEFWSTAFTMSEEDKEKHLGDPEGWKDHAPSEKLYLAAASLGSRKKILDYGCGSAWASVIAAKNGCPDITAPDVSKGGIDAADFFCSLYGVTDQVHTMLVSPDWLSSVPDGTYDGLFCSNVLDVVPEETSAQIIRESARVVADGSPVIIGMNYWMSPEKAAEKSMDLLDGRKVYVNGILRLVSFSDEEWTERFSPYFIVERLDHFAWPHETEETRRLFYLRKR